MTSNMREQEKQRKPPKDSRFRNPLNVVVEKIGTTRARVHGDLSKESLKELLMSSLTLVPEMSRSKKEKGVTAADSEERIKVVDLTKNVEEQSSIERFEKNALPKRKAEDKESKKFTAQKLATEVRQVVEKETKTKSLPEDVELIDGRKAEERKATRQQRILEAKTKKDVLGSPRKKKDEKLIWKAERMMDKSLQDLEESYIGEEESEKDLFSEETIEETLPSCESIDARGTKLSYDGQWLRKHLKTPLVLAMKEIVAKNPRDPVRYLAFWLLNYRNSQEMRQWDRETEEELSKLRDAIPQSVSVVEEREDEEKGTSGEEEEGGARADWNFKNYETIGKAGGH